MKSSYLSSEAVKLAAKEVGFTYCGISRASFLEEEAPRLEAWLARGFQGSMGYLENHFDKRLDPRRLVEGAKSVVSVLYNYHIPEPERYANRYFKISSYAHGDDYHLVLKEKLRELVARMTALTGTFTYRVFVDSAPVMDKVWAAKSGLGWMGKHTNLINRQLGSFFFIGEIICDLELEPDGPVKDYCGTCTACLDACPTEAIVAPYVVDGSKCISYFTIEMKDKLQPEVVKDFEKWAFGCDICQDVCPWNRFAKPTYETRFTNKKTWHEWTLADWQEVSEETFKQVFRDSPIKRTKFDKLQHTIQLLVTNASTDTDEITNT